MDAVLLVDGEPYRVVVSKRGAGGRRVIKLDRPVSRGASLAVPPRRAARRRRRTPTTSSSSSACASRRRAAATSASSPTSRTCPPTTRSCSTAACCCRWSRRACSTSTSRPAASWSPAASPTPSNLTSGAPRRLHPGSACVRVDDRAAAARGRARHRARAAPLQLPRHDALCGPARWTTSRTEAAREWCCAWTSSPPRSRRCTAATPEHRVIALTPQGRPLTQAVVEELAARGAPDAALVALRGLRRAHRHAPLLRCDLDRPLRPLRRGAARDGPARRAGAPPSRRARGGLG